MVLGYKLNALYQTGKFVARKNTSEEIREAPPTDKIDTRSFIVRPSITVNPKQK